MALRHHGRRLAFGALSLAVIAVTPALTRMLPQALAGALSIAIITAAQALLDLLVCERHEHRGTRGQSAA